jgi:hypothetical protein
MKWQRAQAWHWREHHITAAGSVLIPGANPKVPKSLEVQSVNVSVAPQWPLPATASHAAVPLAIKKQMLPALF